MRFTYRCAMQLRKKNVPGQHKDILRRANDEELNTEV